MFKITVSSLLGISENPVHNVASNHDEGPGIVPAKVEYTLPVDSGLAFVDVRKKNGQRDV